MVTATPARVTPRLGTESAPTSLSNAKANVKVAVNDARTTFWRRSRYHSRMNRGESVLVAIWTTSTPMVTTRPTRPIIAPATADSTPAAVDGEYDHAPENVIWSSSHRSKPARASPATVPATGTTHRL